MQTHTCARRDFLRAMGLGAATVMMPTLSHGAGKADSKANILLLFADDQRFDTIHALGNEHIITPHMDSLAHNGVAFTNAYIMGADIGGVCVPSRAMLMTGRTLFHLLGEGREIPPDHIMLPEVLGRAGYTTFGTGKWHNSPQAFNRAFAAGDRIFFGGMSDHYRVPVTNYDPTGNYAGYKEIKKRAQQPGQGTQPGTHSSELFSDAAVKFLRNYKDDKPFFLYVAYTAPHDPRDMPAQYSAMYDPGAIPLPDNFLPEHPFDNGDLATRDEKLAPWPRTPEVIREHIAAYYAMITHLDAHIGRVLAALHEAGHTENTIIVFAGDNGLAVGRHGLMGKQNLYDHSVHVPLIMSGPGIPKGEKRDAFCYLLDVYPTLCDLVGAPIPATVEGKSLIKVLAKPKRETRDTLLFAYKDVQRGVRDKRYKLIEYVVNGTQTTQLFDLEADPWETKNLAHDPNYRKPLKRLRAELRRWKDELDDPAEDFWKRYSGDL